MTTMNTSRVQPQTRTSTLNRDRSSLRASRAVMPLLLDSLGILTLAGLGLLFYFLL